MTKKTDLSRGGASHARHKNGKKPTSSSEPPAIQINMPRQGRRAKQAARSAAKVTPIDKVEALLGKLMSRLDESDQRYTSALDDLNDRLHDISDRADNARGAHSRNAGKSLDRVRDQASSLAAQVNQAGAAHRAQNGAPLADIEHRMADFSSAHDDGEEPYFGDPRLSDDFADVTTRLERSLAERTPANEFEILTTRMDDLAGKFDTALTSSNDMAALHGIESQLEALSAGFNEARENYARVEAIENHLANLMNWAQSTNAPGNDGDHAQLDAIERALHELNQNATEMDARTAGTLEAMNDALHSLAANMESGDAHHNSVDNAARHHAYEAPSPGMTAQPGPDDYAEVWIDEPTAVENAPDAQAEGPDASTSQLGAMIPDYQPAENKPAGKSRTSAQMEQQGRVEPVFEAENDFIASARRAAAAAAAQEPAPRSPKSSPLSGKGLAGMAGLSASGESKRSRPVLVIAAVGLLLVSAGLLVVRLKSNDGAREIGSSQLIAPQPPAVTQDNSSAPAAPAPAPTPDPAATRQEAPGIINAPVTPAQAASGAKANTDKSVPQPASATYSAAKPISTATLLASLPPNAGREQMPGVSIEIREPAARAPALVPQGQNQPKHALMPMPKRAPAQGAGPEYTPANTNPVDSARANEAAAGSGAPQTTMPPARIGPYSLRIAAARGNPAAQVEVASRFAKGTGVAKDLEKAAQWYHRAAAAGFAPAQYRLAALYERGQGVKKDTGMARTWYRRAAELGNVRAMHNLAVLYTRPNAGSPDYASAKNWFLEASRRGLADSQFNLGILYESGLGTRKNTAEAYKWFALAERQGDGEARKRREELHRRLPAKSLAAVGKVLQRWKPAAVDEAANYAGPPRGGWRNARSGPQLQSGDPALVARAQLLLNKLGYDAGVPDGKLGPQTSTAIRKFEHRSGIARTGQVTPALVKKLEALNS